MFSISEIVKKANELGASDIHIVCGLPICIRVNGNIDNLTVEPLVPSECEYYGRELAGDRYEEIETIGEIDMAATFEGGIRARINLFRQQNTVSAAIRILNNKIRTPEELKMPASVANLSNLRNGLVLFTGNTGSGKSTSMAALIDQVNHTRSGHIITLEDPIEYVYKPDKCVVNQREVGMDTRSYADGLKAILREDPDIILVGEMRDQETIEAALRAAETGHLVFSTLHTNSAADTVDRIIGVFPEGQQQQIRVQLSACLRAVVSQQLLPKSNGDGRVAASEVMIVTPAISNLIRDGKTIQIESFIGLGAKEGSITMDMSLQNLVLAKEVSKAVATEYAHDKERFMKF